MGTSSEQFETVIGLEVHVQLITNSKMFCSCSADYSGAEPNTHVCPVCLGLPGVLTVINEEAIRLIVAIGLSVLWIVFLESQLRRECTDHHVALNFV